MSVIAVLTLNQTNIIGNAQNGVKEENMAIINDGYQLMLVDEIAKYDEDIISAKNEITN